MLIGYLLCLGFLTSSKAWRPRHRGWRPPHRGAFAPAPAHPETGSRLTEGDIALGSSRNRKGTGSRVFGSGPTLNSFRRDSADLWPRGGVPYRIDEDEFRGIWEPVFLDSHIRNITISLEKIEAGVPCIEFQ